MFGDFLVVVPLIHRPTRTKISRRTIQYPNLRIWPTLVPKKQKRTILYYKRLQKVWRLKLQHGSAAGYIHWVDQSRSTKIQSFLPDVFWMNLGLFFQYTKMKYTGTPVRMMAMPMPEKGDGNFKDI